MPPPAVAPPAAPLDRFPWLLGALRCPVSGDALARDGEALATPGGTRAFPLLEGVPVLLDPDNELFGRTDLGSRSASEQHRASVSRLIGRARSHNFAAATNFALVRDRLLDGPPRDRRPRVLVVGGRVAGDGSAALLGSAAIDVVETDVSLGPRTSIVCDGHQLPFADGTFDAVVCQAVLEHVLDPWTVAGEIHRVLRADGIVYSEVPFMQQVHEGAYDFTRFTHLGHRRVWRSFAEIDSGATCGPGMVLAWSTEYLLAALLPDHRVARRAARVVAAVLGLLLTPLDRVLTGTAGGLDGASGTYFLGTRATTPLPDAQLLAGYRGAGPQVGWVRDA